MTINFPGNCTTPEDRLAWSYRMQEKLRLLQNYMWKWSKQGISLNVHNQFPNRVKDVFPYDAGLLSDNDHSRFTTKLLKLEEALWVAIGQEKQKAFDSEYWNPDIDADIVE